MKKRAAKRVKTRAPGKTAAAQTTTKPARTKAKTNSSRKTGKKDSEIIPVRKARRSSLSAKAAMPALPEAVVGAEKAAGLAAAVCGDRPLPPRQKMFVAAYLANKGNAKQAAIEAGYSAKTAESQASRLLRNVKVKAAIDAELAPTFKRLEVTKEYVLESIVSMIEHCKQKPVTYRGMPIPGEFTVDAFGVLKGAELLGKHLKLFTDKVEHSFDLSDLSDEELKERLAKHGVNG